MKAKIWKIFFILTIVPIIIISYAAFLAFNSKCNIGEGNQDGKTKLRIIGPMESDDPHLIRHLIKHVLIPPSTSHYNLSTFYGYIAMKHYYSWGPIYRALKSLFSNSTQGFFVEAGALDGEYLSNSLWLEQAFNWTGLLIEPEQINFRDMVWKRRKAWLSHSCLSDEPFPKEITLVSLRRKVMDRRTVLPLDVRGSSLQYEYIDKARTNYTADFYKELDFSYYRVQCYPLYSSLLALNISVIDFLSLDLQGSEMGVFSTIPLDKIFIRSFVVEDLQQETNYKLIKHYNNLGFDLFSANSNGPDYFFVNRNDSILMEMGKSLGMAQRLIDRGLISQYPRLPFGKSNEEIK